MSLKIFNSMTGKKEDFIPLSEKRVRMYACGVTVYDLCHIGHARSATVFDSIRKYLEYKGFEVIFVKNFTDIDDKIINKANSEKKSCEEISSLYIKEYYEDMHVLGVKDATVEPKATQYVQEIIEMVSGLIEKGYAYEIGGDVYFSVRKFSNYGKLSKKNIEDLEVGARVEVDERKKDPLDFALWKSSKPDEPFWISPWGNGRPGWHIECSVMSMKLLGESFDIHGGGKDLIFPHHENEIAQSEAFSGKLFARYWVHNGFVNINNEKMSKSLGNFFTIKDILKLYPPEAVRFFLLSTHYRSPIDFSEENLKNALSSLDRVYTTLLKIEEIKRSKSTQHSAINNQQSIVSTQQSSVSLSDKIRNFRISFEKAMDDDFNSAKAVGKIFELIKEINIFTSEKKEFLKTDIDCLLEAERTVKKSGEILGLFKENPREWFMKGKVKRGISYEITEDEIKRLILEREEARKKKEWQIADKIRQTLLDKNIVLEDVSSGTKWRRLK